WRKGGRGRDSRWKLKGRSKSLGKRFFMIEKQKKNISTPWNDAAQPPINQLWDEIESRFGICPSFFKLAQSEPPIARDLFRQAEFAYLDNPMPMRFKGRLFTWLSRLCESTYWVVRHFAFLLRQGVSAD